MMMLVVGFGIRDLSEDGSRERRGMGEWDKVAWLCIVAKG